MTQQQIATRLQAYKTSALVEVTGFDQSSINRWKKGGKMTTAVLAMWRFFFELEDMRRENETLKEAFRLSNS